MSFDEILDLTAGVCFNFFFMSSSAWSRYSVCMSQAENTDTMAATGNISPHTAAATGRSLLRQAQPWAPLRACILYPTLFNGNLEGPLRHSCRNYWLLSFVPRDSTGAIERGTGPTQPVLSMDPHRLQDLVS